MHATISNASILPPRQNQHNNTFSTTSVMSTSQHGSIPPQQTIASNDGLPLHISPFYGPNFPQQNTLESTFIQQKQQTTASFDPRNLEIKTRSVEQTLLPLVQQISTLVNFKETILTGGRPKSDRALRAALKIGTAVEAAVERFVAVGETIADENPDIQPELYDACHEARIAGSSIANLHGSMLAEPASSNFPMENGDTTIFPNVNTTQLVRAARQLLSSVTRVLLLADRVLVKHILRAEDKIAYSLTKLENTSNFTEFVQVFTEFGGQMVDLAHRSGDRQQDLKSEKRQAQMQVARAQLERLTMLLLTSAKTLLRHPDDPAAIQCRDGVFHQIRSALQLIAICVTDGVMAFDAMNAYSSPLDELFLETDGPLDIGIQLTASVAIRQLCEMLDMCRMMSLIGAGVRERLISALSALCEMSIDFTDSSWTPNQQREQVLDLLEECRFEMGNLVNPPTTELGNDERLRNESIQVTVERLNRRLKDLRKQLQLVALEQIAIVFRQNEDQTLLSSLKTCSISGDIDGVERFLEQFRIHAEHLQEVCRLLHHISITDSLHVFTGHAERNLRSLAPLTLLSGRILCVHPSSRIARENLEVFCDTWATNVNDLARLTKEIDAACSGRLAAEKQAYMSLPRPGVSNNSNLWWLSNTPQSGNSPLLSSSTRSSTIANSFASNNIFCSGFISNSNNCCVHSSGNCFLPKFQQNNYSDNLQNISTNDNELQIKEINNNNFNEENFQKMSKKDVKKKKERNLFLANNNKQISQDGNCFEELKKKNKNSRINLMSISAILKKIKNKKKNDLIEDKDAGKSEKDVDIKDEKIFTEINEENLTELNSNIKEEKIDINFNEKNEEENNIKIEQNFKVKSESHSPVYAEIIKRPTNELPDNLKTIKVEDVKESVPKKDENNSKISPNSAFTPYEKFINNQKQEQQKTSKTPQIYIYNSPPIRRQLNNNNLRKSDSSNEIIKFNRIGIGFDEPVILRQWEDSDTTTTCSTQDSSSGYATEYSKQQNLNEENNYATLIKKKTKTAPLAKCDEVDVDDEDENEEEDEESEENNEETEEEQPSLNEDNIKNSKNNFVVRMRNKKEANKETSLVNTKFGQRISQILESLQAEAESLIELHNNKNNNK